MDTNKAILGIDIAKAKLDVCLLTPKKERHKVFANTPEGFEKLAAWCPQQGAQSLHVCLEATGWYGEAVSLALHTRGHTVSVINPARIKAFGRSEGQRTKTDKTDAGVIARFCKAHNPAAWTPPTEARRGLRALYRTLTSLKEQQQQCTNRLENDSAIEFVKSVWYQMVDVLQEQIERCEKEIAALVAGDSGLKQAVANVSSIKGVGFITAVAILAETPDVSGFEDVRQFTAFAGLNPCERQSGSSVRGKARLSKQGSARLRKALYMPAIVAKNTNKHLEPFCKRLENKGKHGKVIIGAMMRKLLHIIYGILKHGVPFDPKRLMQTAGNKAC
jgi:transposase